MSHTPSYGDEKGIVDTGAHKGDHDRPFKAPPSKHKLETWGKRKLDYETTRSIIRKEKKGKTPGLLEAALSNKKK